MTASEPTNRSRLKAILGGSAGNLVEWYDWFAYSSFALYFAKHFFPKGDQTAQLLQAAAVFAVGFLARPLGAWLMGLYADRVGRRAALTMAVALMSAGSFAIALIPGYDHIGVWAPIALVAARLVQGLSVGGEYGASATYMSEMAGKDRRGFWSSFQYVTLISGQLTALAVLIVLQHSLAKADLEAWGWRIPFVIGGLLAIVVFWMRTGLNESASFENVAQADRPKVQMGHVAVVGGLFLLTLAGCGFVLKTLGMETGLGWCIGLLVLWQLSMVVPLARRHPKEVFSIIGLTAAGSLSFYAYTTYMQKFLVNTSGFSKDAATAISAASLLVYMCAQPIYGLISDKLGRKVTMGFAFGVGSIITFPVMSALAGTSNMLTAFGLVTALVLAHSGYSSVSAVVKAEMFPAHIRALGVALPYAIGNAVFGGTAEYVALAFKSAGHESGFYAYVAILMAIALIITIRLRNTQKHSLILED